MLKPFGDRVVAVEKKAAENASANAEAAKEDSAKKEYSAEEISHFVKLNERKKELDAREEELSRLEAELLNQKAELEKKMAKLIQTSHIKFRIISLSIFKRWLFKRTDCWISIGLTRFNPKRFTIFCFYLIIACFLLINNRLLFRCISCFGSVSIWEYRTTHRVVRPCT